MKTAFVFPGQGAQKVGMGKNLCNVFPEAKKIFDTANEIMEYDLSKIIFEGPEEELKKTEVTQPAVFVTSIAYFEVSRVKNPEFFESISFTAGHSLGEYSALYASGVFDFSNTLNLVRKRAKFMADVSQENPGTMAAILGLTQKQVGDLCEKLSGQSGRVEMANFNTPGQIVVSGQNHAVRELLNQARKLGAVKSVLLNVSGAFHSSFMKPAAELFAKEIEKVTLKEAKIPVVTNCDAKITTSGTEISEKLVRQIYSPVLWQKSVEKMISEGVETFIECGPGKILSGMIKRINRTVRVETLETLYNEV